MGTANDGNCYIANIAKLMKKLLKIEKAAKF